MRCRGDYHDCCNYRRCQTVFIVPVVVVVVAVPVLPTLLARVPARIDRDVGGIVEFGGNSCRSGHERTTAIVKVKVTAIATVLAAPPTSKSAPAAPADESLEPNDPSSVRIVVYDVSRIMVLELHCSC